VAIAFHRPVLALSNDIRTLLESHVNAYSQPSVLPTQHGTRRLPASGKTPRQRTLDDAYIDQMEAHSCCNCLCLVGASRYIMKSKTCAFRHCKRAFRMIPMRRQVVGTTPKHPADLYLLPCTRACIRRQDCGIVIVSMYRIKRSCGKGKCKQDVGDSTDPQVSGKLGLITVRNGQVKDPDTQMLGETPCTKRFCFSRGISML
jgi:hypothetical protein